MSLLGLLVMLWPCVEMLPTCFQMVSRGTWGHPDCCRCGCIFRVMTLPARCVTGMGCGWHKTIQKEEREKSPTRRVTVLNYTYGPVTSQWLKKRPFFHRVRPSHASRMSFLTEFDWVKRILVKYDWDLGHKVDLKMNVTVSHFQKFVQRSNLRR